MLHVSLPQIIYMYSSAILRLLVRLQTASIALYGHPKLSYDAYGWTTCGAALAINTAISCIPCYVGLHMYVLLLGATHNVSRSRSRQRGTDKDTYVATARRSLVFPAKILVLHSRMREINLCYAVILIKPHRQGLWRSETKKGTFPINYGAPKRATGLFGY